jgi:hypothetical protein
MVIRATAPIAAPTSVVYPGAVKGASRRQAEFGALAVPNFRRYVSGQALSLIGTWTETVAQALLVLRLTNSRNGVSCSSPRRDWDASRSSWASSCFRAR